jgi:hypothetical protein
MGNGTRIGDPELIINQWQLPAGSKVGEEIT